MLKLNGEFMGYYTSFELNIEAIDKSTETDNVTIESIIEQISSANSIDKEELLLKLDALKNGGKVTVTDLHIIEKFRETYEYAKHALAKDGGPYESCKWYEHEEQLRKFSTKYPNWLFTLEGKGEEAGDLWKKYFVNGKMQLAKAEIVFDKFEPSKLS
jgi:hypothetical protein